MPAVKQYQQTNKMKLITLLTLLLTASVAAKAEADQPVHLFILSGQSNMAGMDPETGFMPEARKLFNDEEVVYIKVAKGGQPICRWLEEWDDIAKEKGLSERERERLWKGEAAWRLHPPRPAGNKQI